MAIREFYGSPHYLAIPYVQIGTELRALLLAKPHPLKPSDNMDVFNIAAVRPYADLMVIDGAMSRVQRSAGWLSARLPDEAADTDRRVPRRCLERFVEAGRALAVVSDVLAGGPRCAVRQGLPSHSWSLEFTLA